MSSRAVRVALTSVFVVAALSFAGTPASSQAGPTTAPTTAPTTTPTFDASAIASPSEELVDGQIIEISGTGFEPDRQLRVYQCFPHAERTCYPYQLIQFDEPDADGSFETRAQVRNVIRAGDGFEVNCHVQACTLFVTSSYFGDDLDEHPSAMVPISISEDSLPMGPMWLTVTPSEDLVNGQMVAIEAGSMVLCNWFVGAECDPPRFVQMCQFGSGGGCVDLGSRQLDEFGHFRIDVALPAVFEFESRELDCRLSECVVMVIWQNEFVSPLVPVEFASEVDDTTTSTTTSATAVPALPAQPVDAAPTFTG